MRINQHILQGFLISIILILTAKDIALYNFSAENIIFYFILVLSPFFILLGSIYPDVDVRKPWRLKGNGFFSLLFSLIKILIAYPLRWFIYYPSYWIMQQITPKRLKHKIRDEHHLTTHNFLGIIVASVVLFIMTNFILFLIKKASYSIDIFKLGLLISSSVIIGFIFGVLIHFLQDSFSKHGIRPLEPFNQIRFSGRYSSWDHLNRKDKVMSFFIFIILLIIPWANQYIFQNTASMFTASVLTIIFDISTILIIFFAYGIEFNSKVETRKRKIYLKKYLVRGIVILLALNLIGYIFFINTDNKLDFKQETVIKNLNLDESQLEQNAEKTCQIACQKNGGVSITKPVQKNHIVDCICKEGLIKENQVVIN